MQEQLCNRDKGFKDMYHEYQVVLLANTEL